MRTTFEVEETVEFSVFGSFFTSSFLLFPVDAANIPAIPAFCLGFPTTSAFFETI